MGYFYSPFRAAYQKPSTGCPFCDPETMRAQTICDHKDTPFANDHYRWVVNSYPKFEGHTMLVPQAHLTTLASETEAALLARHELLQQALPVLQRAYPDCGLEYFLQTGPGSASSVAHLHWHLVPAYPNDELRSFEKLGHFYTTEPDEEKVVIFPKRITMSPDELLTHLQNHS